MRLTCILALLLLHATFLSTHTMAQDEPEYRMEIGGSLGLTAYQGDFSSSLMADMQPMFGVTARYKMNPRMAWAVLLNTGQLKGSSDGVKTWYPEIGEEPYSFSTSLTEFTVRYEYNFFPFGTGEEYLGAKPLTPFITLGAGLAFASDKESTVAFQMPIGLGLKYKLRPRLNLTAEWTMHFTGSDRLDGMKDPYGIKSDGLFKNTDSFCTMLLSLTYDIWARCKTCHNDKE